MDYFAGLDVSVKDTSVCIVDETGKITREVIREADSTGCHSDRASTFSFIDSACFFKSPLTRSI